MRRANYRSLFNNEHESDNLAASGLVVAGNRPTGAGYGFGGCRGTCLLGFQAQPAYGRHRRANVADDQGDSDHCLCAWRDCHVRLALPDPWRWNSLALGCIVEAARRFASLVGLLARSLDTPLVVGARSPVPRGCGAGNRGGEAFVIAGQAHRRPYQQRRRKVGLAGDRVAPSAVCVGVVSQPAQPAGD